MADRVYGHGFGAAFALGHEVMPLYARSEQALTEGAGRLNFALFTRGGSAKFSQPQRTLDPALHAEVLDAVACWAKRSCSVDFRGCDLTGVIREVVRKLAAEGIIQHRMMRGFPFLLMAFFQVMFAVGLLGWPAFAKRGNIERRTIYAGFQYGFTAPLACSAQGPRCGSFVFPCIHRLIEVRGAPMVCSERHLAPTNAVVGS